MLQYERNVFYYETDKMGIVHHSNYIRYMEESRVHALDEIGYNFFKLEEEGYGSPVVSVQCEYRRPLAFGDHFRVEVYCGEHTASKFTILYEIYKGDELCAKGSSLHCFVKESGKIVNLKKEMPGFLEAFEQHRKE